MGMKKDLLTSNLLKTDESEAVGFGPESEDRRNRKDLLSLRAPFMIFRPRLHDTVFISYRIGSGNPI